MRPHGATNAQSDQVYDTCAVRCLGRPITPRRNVVKFNHRALVTYRLSRTHASQTIEAAKNITPALPHALAEPLWNNSHANLLRTPATYGTDRQRRTESKDNARQWAHTSRRKFAVRQHNPKTAKVPEKSRNAEIPKMQVKLNSFRNSETANHSGTQRRDIHPTCTGDTPSLQDTSFATIQSDSHFR